MPFTNEIKKEIYKYCENHLADDAWYENQFDFILDEAMKKRLICEFKATRFAYKLYEGLEAENENLLFEVRNQIISYATIYEAVIHYVLYNYYQDTEQFHDMTHHTIPIKISIPEDKQKKLEQELLHDNKEIATFYYGEKKKEEKQIRFDDKCITAKNIGLLHDFENSKGQIIDLPSEIIEFYWYRNGIHLIAEQRKGIQYELELSKRAYRRMQPFIEQIKSKLAEDGKC